jgi:hypothetical protein
MKKSLLVVGCLLMLCCLLILGVGGGGYIYLQNQLPSLVAKNNISSKGFTGRNNIESYETESTVSTESYIESEVLEFAYGQARVDLNSVYDQVTKVNVPQDEVEKTVTTNPGTSDETTETVTEKYSDYVDQMLPESLVDEIAAKNQFTVKDSSLNGKDYWEVTIELADSPALKEYLEATLSKSFLDGVASGGSNITVSDPEIEYGDDFTYTIVMYISKQTYLVERTNETMSGDVIMTSRYSGETGATFEDNGINPSITFVISSVETETVYNSLTLKQPQPKDALNLWLYSNGKF